MRIDSVGQILLLMSGGAVISSQDEALTKGELFNLSERRRL